MRRSRGSPPSRRRRRRRSVGAPPLRWRAPYFGLDLDVYMVKVSLRAETLPPRGHPHLRRKRHSLSFHDDGGGQKDLGRAPRHGRLAGLRHLEAVEKATQTPQLPLCPGLRARPTFLLHQSIIGQECKIALDKYGVQPDLIIRPARAAAPTWAASSRPSWGRSSKAKNNIDFLAVEPASCPSPSRAASTPTTSAIRRGITPLAKMYTLGCGFMPSPNHAGGLRYHGMSPRALQALSRRDICARRASSRPKVF